MKNTHCLFPPCLNGTLARGLCNTHYRTAARLVKEGLTTWEIMEKAGKSVPTRYAGGRGQGAAAKWLTEAAEQPVEGWDHVGVSEAEMIESLNE